MKRDQKTSQRYTNPQDAVDRERRTCPICASSAGEQFSPAGGAGATILRCLSCGLLYRGKLEREDESAYWSQYVESACEQAYDALRGPYFDVWWRRVRSLVQDRRRDAGPRRVLDVGCVPGSLLRRAVEDGWEAHGVETSAALCELSCRASPTARVWEGFLERIDFGGIGFDLIVAGDCLRHASRPLEFAQAATRLLKPGGALVIRELDAAHRKHELRVSHPNPFDMQFFDERTLCALLRSTGLINVQACGAPMSLMTNRRLRSLARKSVVAHHTMVRAANSVLRAVEPLEALRGERLSSSFMVFGYRSQRAERADTGGRES